MSPSAKFVVPPCARLLLQDRTAETSENSLSDGPLRLSSCGTLRDPLPSISELLEEMTMSHPTGGVLGKLPQAPKSDRSRQGSLSKNEKDDAQLVEERENQAGTEQMDPEKFTRD